jgi:hypothetical protein
MNPFVRCSFTELRRSAGGPFDVVALMVFVVSRVGVDRFVDDINEHEFVVERREN